VIIDVPTDVEVTIESGPLVVSSIISEESLLINTELTVNGTILNNGGITMGGGTLINAYVLPNSTQDIGMTSGGVIRNVRMGRTISSGIRRNSLTVEDGLTLDGAIVVWGGSGSIYSTASFNGNSPYTINGTGEILIGNGNLGITGNWTNNNSITIQDDGTLNISGTYNNQGTIVATESTVNLGGEFTTAGLGGFSRTGGSVRITGTLDNGPGLVLDSTTGSWVIAGGRVVGGVLDTLDGTTFSATGRNIGSPILDGVTMNGTLGVGPNTTLVIVNDLTLNGLIYVAGASGSGLGSINFDTSTPQTLNGTGTMQISTNGGVNAGELTVGPDITLSGATGNYVASGSFVIMGTVLPDISTSFSVDSQSNMLTNSGLFHARSPSTLTVRGLASNDGIFQIESGSVIATQRAGYTQSVNGTLIIDIRGLGTTNHGQLTATEAVSLAGSLTLNLVDSYEPEISDTFIIVTGTSITGIFDTINGLVIGNGKQFDVIYNATDVTLEVIAGP